MNIISFTYHRSYPLLPVSGPTDHEDGVSVVALHQSVVRGPHGPEVHHVHVAHVNTEKRTVPYRINADIVWNTMGGQSINLDRGVKYWRQEARYWRREAGAEPSHPSGGEVRVWILHTCSRRASPRLYPTCPPYPRGVSSRLYPRGSSCHMFPRGSSPHLYPRRSTFSANTTLPQTSD